MKFTAYLILSISLLLKASFVFAGKDGKSVGARSAGLSGIASLQYDLWSAENNPAGLSQVKSFAGGLNYENYFLLEELAQQSAIIAYPTSNGAFGLSIQQFGFELYQENKIGLSYGQQLSPNFSIGVQLNYLSTQIGEGYGEKSGLSGNVGIQGKLNDNLSIAAVVINPNRLKLNEYNEEAYPSIIRLGLAYKISKKVQIFNEYDKDLDHDPNVKMGLEYQPNEQFFFRLGYASEPSSPSFGFGLLLGDWSLDLSSQLYDRLGFSPQISLAYRIKKSNQANNEK